MTVLDRPTGATQQLAAFALANEALPAGARHAARRTLLNALALGVGAAQHPATLRAFAATQRYRPRPQATLFGRAERSSPQWAALVNGIAVHVEDFDDTHLRALIHPGAMIVPAALAAAEIVDADGEALLQAVARGVEVTLRIGDAVMPSIHHRGWHVSGTAGHIGAAAAVARILGLDRRQTCSAFAIGSTQAAGLGAASGSMTKSFHLGKAAADGVEAGFLAREGFSGPLDPIEGRRGFAELFAGGFDAAAMTGELGERFELERNAFKPYACGVMSHAMIDGAIALHDAGVRAEEVVRVDVRVNPLAVRVMGREQPANSLESKFSVYHSVAVGLIDGKGGPQQFSDAAAVDPQIAALRELVRVHTDPAIPNDEAFVSATLRDGTVHEHHTRHASGSAGAPLTDAQLHAKADLVARPVLGERTQAFMETAWRVDQLASVRELTALLCPAGDVRAH